MGVRARLTAPASTVRPPVNDAASSALYERALTLLPGGVNSPVRAMRAIGRDPLFIAAAEGAHIVDVDGNRYLDYVCSWGPLIAGHAHAHVIEAVAGAAARGTSFGAPTEREVDLAAAIAERMPAVEMVRMTSSGTEATMTAVRLARAVTGRERLVKFAGAYHGHLDGLLAQAGSGMATQAIPSSPGVPEAATRATTIVPFNDRDAVTAALSGHDVAALLVEPIAANMGVVTPAPGFLEHLRAATREAGTLLIADEVITGFRVARGGAQELLGTQPDLVIMGKVVGGGLPAAALGGPRATMDRLAPAGDVYQAGTLSGNPLATAAGLATLDLLTPDAYARLGAVTDALAAGLREAAAGRPVTVTSVPGLLTVFFTERAPTRLEEVQAADLDAHAAFCRALLERGVYAPASQFEAWFPSLAHTDADVRVTVDAAREAFDEALGPR